MTEENKDIRRITTIGKIVAAAGGLIVFSNLMGAFAFSFMGMSEFYRNERSGMDAGGFLSLEFILINYRELCAIMIIIGLCYLFGGIYLAKRRLWAKNLVMVTSVLLLIAIWLILAAMAISFGKHEDVLVYQLAAFGSAAAYSIPLVLLIVFLSRKKTKIYFGQ